MTRGLDGDGKSRVREEQQAIWSAWPSSGLAAECVRCVQPRSAARRCAVCVGASVARRGRGHYLYILYRVRSVSVCRFFYLSAFSQASHMTPHTRQCSTERRQAAAVRRRRSRRRAAHALTRSRAAARVAISM